jgi:hypothetical protein
MFGVACIAACFFAAFSGKQVQNSFAPFIEHTIVESWINYKCDDLGFSVDFPTKPIKQAKQLNISSANRKLDYEEYVSYQDEQKGTYYSVSSIQLPSKWRFFSSSTLLKGALKVLTESDYDNELVSKGFINHKSYPAIDFCMKQGDEQTRGRLILINHTIYKLTAVYPQSEAEAMKNQAFLDSFNLSNQKTK